MVRTREEIQVWLGGPEAKELERWEKRRGALRVLRRARFVVYGALLAALFYFGFTAGIPGDEVILMGMLLALPVAGVEMYLVSQDGRRKSGAFAMEVIDPVVEFLYPGFKYDPHEGLEEYEYLGSNLFEFGTEYRSASGLEGDLEGSLVKLSEVESLAMTGSGQFTTVTTNHRGWLLKTAQEGVGAEMVMIRPQEVAPKKKMHGLKGFNFRGGLEGPSLPKWEMKEVAVSPEFGEHFVVSASDPARAAVLLSEEMEEALLALREAPDPDERMVFVSWFDNQLYIGRRSGRALLDPGPDASLIKPGWLEAVQGDVEVLFDLVRLARRIEAATGVGAEVEEVERAVEEEAAPALQWDDANRAGEW